MELTNTEVAMMLAFILTLVDQNGRNLNNDTQKLIKKLQDELNSRPLDSLSDYSPESELQKWKQRALDAETRLAIRAARIDATETKGLLPLIGQSLGMTAAESVAIAGDQRINTWDDLVALLERWLADVRAIAGQAQQPEGE
jgi:hypothetical protein